MRKLAASLALLAMFSMQAFAQQATGQAQGSPEQQKSNSNATGRGSEGFDTPAQSTTTVHGSTGTANAQDVANKANQQNQANQKANAGKPVASGGNPRLDKPNTVPSPK
jgi:hypothetical protein